MARAMIRVHASRALVAGLSIATAALLQGCAASTSYPSLAPRAVERIEGSGTPAPGTAEAVPTLPPASADLTTRVDGLLAAAKSAHATFQARQASAELAVAGAGAVTSDSWTAAEVALSDLQATRSGAVTALGELDQLYVDARAANPEQVSPAAAAIGTARDQVEAWVQSEDAVISRLNARLKS